MDFLGGRGGVCGVLLGGYSLFAVMGEDEDCMRLGLGFRKKETTVDCSAIAVTHLGWDERYIHTRVLHCEKIAWVLEAFLG